MPTPVEEPKAATKEPKATAKEAKDEKIVRVKKDNNNALVIKLGGLGGEVTAATGDPWFCRGCGAAVSTLSQLTTSGQTTSWTW